MIKFGIIKEGKTPPDERVPLTPTQLSIFKEDDGISVKVASSDIRRITDAEYNEAGFETHDSVNDCDVLLGVKEVPIDELVPGKTHLFFSHTIKMQPYNKGLLQAVLDKKIRLIDWECLTDSRGARLIGFGRYAGIVGAYNGFRLFGHKSGLFDLKKAQACQDRKEMEAELDKMTLPALKILLTGRGKVAKGAIETLTRAGIKRVEKDAFLNESFDEPVYCQITFRDYFEKKNGEEFETQEFFDHPDRFQSCFMPFARVTDYFIAGHYWNSEAPFLFTREDAKREDFNISLIADVSCDIDGPVASTIRPSTISEPFYGYDPKSESEVSYNTPDSIAVMAVDNLPCELPRDASFDFGEMFLENVLPAFLNGDEDGILDRATIAQDGELTPRYAYLSDWVNG